MLDSGILWQAVQARDRSLDGRFFYGVLTTGVFCRPGCPSRLPRPQNVRFYATAEEAQSAGLRPCLRCKPLEPAASSTRTNIQAVCTFIRRHLDDRNALKLENLALRANLSPFHFQRTFKSIVGVTPRQYAEALRVQTLKQDLKTSASVTQAIYSAGFGSGSHVYQQADTSLGMTPGEYRAGGKNVEISYAIAQTPLGLMMLGATDRGLCFLEFGDTREQLLVSLQQEYPAAARTPMQKPYSPQFTAWMQSLIGYLEGQRAIESMPVALNGTAFQRKVWNHLQTIPPGTVQSYTEVAAAIGHPRAVRAVGSACAANRVGIVVPCHRVIRGDGKLGGYRWGLHRKRALLDAERRAASNA